MKKRDLEELLVIANQHARERTARADELLVSNGNLLERARAAETDRRIAIELLLLARKIMVPASGLTADKISDFLMARGLLD